MECRKTDSGSEYMGTVRTTESGIECQAWTADTPHANSDYADDKFPDGSAEAASNYCRNPSGDSFVWCYTMDPSVRWEECDIPRCCKSAWDLFITTFYVCLWYTLNNRNENRF